MYQMHPTAVHSEFGVMLVPLDGPHRPDMGWMDVQITNRLINQVWMEVWIGKVGEEGIVPTWDGWTCRSRIPADQPGVDGSVDWLGQITNQPRISLRGGMAQKVGALRH